MKKNKYIIANWKMNKTVEEAIAYSRALEEALLQEESTASVVVFPSAIALSSVAGIERHLVEFGVQNFYPENCGGFTGENSLIMLEGLHCSWCMVGHSERRTLFGENDSIVAKKLNYAVQMGFSVILCVGEDIVARGQCRTKEILLEQLAVLDELEAFPADIDVCIAYEPVWAIGTGCIPAIEEISEALQTIQEYAGKTLAYSNKNVYTLYGGSVTAQNASNILSAKYVDGVLVGSASLDIDSFITIIRS